MITGRARLAGVMGFPVSHSLSPRLHNHWLQKYGIDGAYIPLPIRREDIRDAFSLLPRLGFKGWNVTVPHKETALTLVDDCDDIAGSIGAVNTVIVREDGTLFGINTDATGFAKHLKQCVPDFGSRRDKALVLGAGGAARAVCRALIDDGMRRVVIANRTHTRAEEIALRIAGVEAVAWEYKEGELAEVDLLVNATTLGMEGYPPLKLSLENLSPQAVVADIVYRPLHTELLKQASARGCRTVTGLGMLIHQAVQGFTAWFGIEPEITPDLETLLLS